MESLPQELIDKFIDNLPHPSLRSCSLVGRRWRRRSQERVFASVGFSSERDLGRWYANIPQDPSGIPSYVRSVRFQCIHSWRDPTLFGRVLKTFTSMTSLFMLKTAIPRPRNVPNSVPFGEFGQKIDWLMLLSPQCTASTIMAFILSLPNLERFYLIEPEPKKSPSTLQHASQMRQLAELHLHAAGTGVGTALAQCRLTSRKLSLVVSEAGLEQLLTLSSKVVVELGLSDQYSSELKTLQAKESPSTIPLPPLPALTTVRVDLLSEEPSPRLAYILSTIHSAPAITSVTFTSDGWYGEYFPSSGPWVDVDRWLVRMTLQTEVKGSLAVKMMQRPEEEPVWEESFPEFRKAGGKLTIETVVDDD